jgi:protein-S-isoprenylcysteine O-methyltransferase Ste14
MSGASKLTQRLARLRVPLGFASGVLVLWLARPTWRTIAVGVPIACVGEGLRIWAAGHLEKSREVTRSGPYRWLGHPLYVGSSIMALGLAIACGSVAVAVLIAFYMVTTLTAAIRAENAFLRARFGDDYAAWQAGTTAAVLRPFTWERARRNREHRAVVGLAAGVALLAIKAVVTAW